MPPEARFYLGISLASSFIPTDAMDQENDTEICLTYTIIAADVLIMSLALR